MFAEVRFQSVGYPTQREVKYIASASILSFQVKRICNNRIEIAGLYGKVSI